MANKFYQPGEARAAKVEELFSAVAPRYDLINDLQSFGLHRHWKRRLVKLAGVKRGHRVLDLCCGTGDVMQRLARQGVQVVGIDFTDSMLAVAKDRLSGTNQDLAFVRGDALRLPFRDGTFDAVAVSYGLRNLADFNRGLEEMCRVAKPGGRLLVLDFGKPRHRVLRAAYFAYLRYGVPLFGRWLCGDAAMYAYIIESLRRYPAQEGIAAMMRQRGCVQVQVFNLLGGMMSINYARNPGSPDALLVTN